MKIFIFIIFAVSYVRSQLHQYHDNIGASTKVILQILCKELEEDVRLKMRQIDSVISIHISTFAFEVGSVLGRIREKYKTMLEMYREARDKATQRSKFLPSSIHHLMNLHYMISLEMIHSLEVDIDQYVELLEHIPPEKLASQPHMRTRDSGEEFAKLRAVVDEEEEKVKRRYREEFMQKKLGISYNDTGRSIPPPGAWFADTNYN